MTGVLVTVGVGEGKAVAVAGKGDRVGRCGEGKIGVGRSVGVMVAGGANEGMLHADSRPTIKASMKAIAVAGFCRSVFLIQILPK